MKVVQVGQFKAEFSSILQEVRTMKETFVIEYGKKHTKMAMLVPYSEMKKKRTFGQLAGTYNVPDDFNEESDEINSMFYENKL